MNGMGLFVCQLVALIVIGRLLGAGFRRIGQPPVVGELLAGVLLALLALEAGLIRESVFTALIVVAIVTSMASGPILSALSTSCRASDTGS